MNVAVIGGGVFGSVAALELAARGHQVTLFERNKSLMQGASANNQNRLHLGFHYPRDDETARQCQRGFARFLAEFAACVAGNFRNAYFIASEGSLTTPDQFLRFCARQRLAHRPIDLAAFRPRLRHVALGILTDELVYDSALLCALVVERLRGSPVVVRTGRAALGIERLAAGGFALTASSGETASFDWVVNCSYAAANQLTLQLGHAVDSRCYEYTAVPIVELEWKTPTGITILDGPFMTVLPFGKSGDYLLYDVQQAVIARDQQPLLDPAWLDPRTAPFARIDQGDWFAKLRERCSRFVPDLCSARLKGVLQGPRMVLAGSEHTDARPSIVTAHEPGYLTVFSGKIDHCLQAAEEVAAAISGRPTPPSREGPADSELLPTRSIG